MTTKHTPGPWHLQPIGRELYVEADGPAFICDMQKDCLLEGMDDSAIMPNARLIASAPELLEALQDCLPWVSDYFCSLDDADQAKEAMAKARAAIAKATGE
jgi:hypothetical protein